MVDDETDTILKPEAVEIAKTVALIVEWTLDDIVRVVDVEA